MACNADIHVGTFGEAKNEIETTAAALDTSYSFGDVIHSGYLEFECCALREGGTGKITQAAVYVDNNGTAVSTSQNFNLYLFKAPPQSQTKNAAMSLASADPPLLACKPISIDSAGDLTANYLWVFSSDAVLPYKCASDNNKLYGILTDSNTDGFASGATFVVRLTVQSD